MNAETRMLHAADSLLTGARDRAIADMLEAAITLLDSARSCYPQDDGMFGRWWLEQAGELAAKARLELVSNPVPVSVRDFVDPGPVDEAF